METLVIFGLVIGLAISIGLNISNLLAGKEKEKEKHRQYILYLVKVDSSGKLEIKQSPKPEIWNWKF